MILALFAAAAIATLAIVAFAAPKRQPKRVPVKVRRNDHRTGR